MQTRLLPGTFTPAGQALLPGSFTGFVAAAAPTADLDALSGKYVPSSATQYTNLSLTAPQSLYLCGEASGNLADSVGALTLTAANAPQYQQAATGFTRLGVGQADAGTGRFTAGVGVGPAAATSTLWMYYATIRTEPTTARIIGGQVRCASSSENVRLSFSPTAGTNRIQVTCDAVGTTGTLDHPAGIYVFVVKYDHSGAGSVFGCSQLDKAAGTYTAAVNLTSGDGEKGLFGNSNPDMVITYAAMWSGAAAEMTQTQIKAMLTTLGWTVNWTAV